MDGSIDEKWLAERLDNHQLEQVVARIKDTHDPRIARAELALRGRGPLPDLVLAAQTTRRPRYVAEAARHLAALGANELAAKLGEGVELRAEDRAWLDPEAPNVDVLALAGAAHAAVSLRREAYALVAKRERAVKKFAEAAAHVQAGHALAPAADDAALWLLALGKDLWAAGERARALETLRQAKEIADKRETAEARAAVSRIAAVCDAIDQRKDDGGPEWTWGVANVGSPFEDARGAVATAVLACKGELGDLLSKPLPTLAHARYALRTAGFECVRCAISDAVLPGVLATGAPLILEEERPTTTGFRVVLGWDPRARLVLVPDASGHGAVLAEWVEQQRRGALFGMSALIVLGSGDQAKALRAGLADAGVAHEPLFDALDACEIDDDGQPPPRARVVELARTILERAPESQLACNRWGDQLLVAWRADRVELPEVLSWYADARERFPDAEWPLQTYAQILEDNGRSHEAGIAWAEAQYRDPWDERNVTGRARALSRMGRDAEAEELFRRAATLAPQIAAPYTWLAHIGLKRKNAESAAVCAELAHALDPKHAAPLSVLASALEAQHRREDALRSLEKARERDAADAYLALRIARGHAAAGRWDQARALGDAAAEHTRDATPHRWSARLAWCAGDRDAGWARVLRGLDRVGFNDELVHAAIAIAVAGTPEEERARIGELRERGSGSLENAGSLSFQLLLHRQFEDGLAVAETFSKANPDEANGDWFVARALLYAGKLAAERARIEEHLEKVVKAAPAYESARTLYALSKLSHDPGRALELARLGGAGSYFATLWWIQTRALAALGDATRAADVTARLRGLSPDIIGRAAPGMRAAGYATEALAILEIGLEAHAGHPALLLELGRTRLAAGSGDALGPMMEAASKGGGRVTGELYRAARAAGKWEVIAEVAAQEVVACDDTRLDEDVWLHRGYVAAAALARGDGGPRDEVLALAGKHPDVLAALVRAGKRDDDRARLVEIAPGRASRLEVTP